MRRISIFTVIGEIARALFGGRRRKGLHRRKIGAAARALDRLAEIEHPGARFAYLRKVDPFTFEEMILTALEREGHVITRNARYTGDGGADGRVKIDGEPYLIQAKRYSGTINPAHVLAFAALCQREQAKGLFVHTGATGKGAWRATDGKEVRIVSGDRLMRLFGGEERLFPPNREAAAAT